jgi:CheY-like chemotaxis protein
MLKGIRHVILVEDDLTALHSLRMQVRSILPHDYVIETANDGAEATEVLEDILAKGGLVPIVISDHQMPKKTGVEFLLRVRSLHPKCRAILLTGQAELTDVTRLVNDQALYRYLAKPWNFVDLQLTIQSALEAFDAEVRMEQLNRALTKTNENLERIVAHRTNELLTANAELREGLEFARMMQQSLLPQRSAFLSYFSEVAILFRPLKFVSGDFYSFYDRGNGKSLMVLGDATGHGVAGAFLSNMAMSMIDNIIYNEVLETPYDVITHILQRFRKLSQLLDGSMRDMLSVELTVVCFDRTKRAIAYASNSRQVMFFKGNELVRPIETAFACCLGNASHAPEPVNRGREAAVDWSAVDRMVLYTDGVPDQFMGVTGKKMGRKALQQHFQFNASPNVAEWFADMQGNELPTDDASLILVQL